MRIVIRVCQRALLGRQHRVQPDRGLAHLAAEDGFGLLALRRLEISFINIIREVLLFNAGERVPLFNRKVVLCLQRDLRLLGVP